MAAYPPPKRLSTLFNLTDYQTTPKDILMVLQSLNKKYETLIDTQNEQINILAKQLEKLTKLVYEQQKIIINIDTKTNDISDKIQQNTEID